MTGNAQCDTGKCGIGGYCKECPNIADTAGAKPEMTDDEIFAKLSEIADEDIMARNPKSIIAVGRALLAAHASSVADAKPCTCHPDDNPPVPCAKQYALSECRSVADKEQK